MPLPHPATFHVGLTDERLNAIAARLLEVRHATFRELSSDLDDAYVRETACFGRSRNMLIGMALSTQYPWLNLSHAALDVTARIDGVPFRFFRDDPDGPEKEGFFKRNAVDDLFPATDKDPMLWRFVIERPESDDGEDRVHFIGYNAYSEKVSHWTYAGGVVANLSGVDSNTPPAKPLPEPTVELLPDDDDITEAS
jgi:hypothetical protein